MNYWNASQIYPKYLRRFLYCAPAGSQNFMLQNCSLKHTRLKVCSRKPKPKEIKKNVSLTFLKVNCERNNLSVQKAVPKKLKPMKIKKRNVSMLNHLYEMAETAYFSWIFTKKLCEIVQNGRFGLFFMKVVEKSYEIVRNGRFGLFSMKVHEKIVWNHTKWPKRPIFHEFTWKNRTKRPKQPMNFHESSF